MHGMSKYQSPQEVVRLRLQQLLREMWLCKG